MAHDRPDKAYGEDEGCPQDVAGGKETETERALIVIQSRRVPNDADGQSESRQREKWPRSDEAHQSSHAQPTPASSSAPTSAA